MSRYTVDLARLARFIGKLDEFSTRSEEVGAAIDRQIAELHENWSGTAASAHREYQSNARDSRIVEGSRTIARKV